MRLRNDDLGISVDARNEAGEGGDGSGNAGHYRQPFGNRERTERFHADLMLPLDLQPSQGQMA